MGHENDANTERRPAVHGVLSGGTGAPSIPPEFWHRAPTDELPMKLFITEEEVAELAPDVEDESDDDGRIE